MCYRHDRGKRGGGGYAPESSVQKLYTLSHAENRNAYNFDNTIIFVIYYIK